MYDAVVLDFKWKACQYASITRWTQGFDDWAPDGWNPVLPFFMDLYSIDITTGVGDALLRTTMPKPRDKDASTTESPPLHLFRPTGSNQEVVHDSLDTRSFDLCPPVIAAHPVLDQDPSQESTIRPGSSSDRPGSNAACALTSNQSPMIEASPAAQPRLFTICPRLYNDHRGSDTTRAPTSSHSPSVRIDPAALPPRPVPNTWLQAPSYLAPTQSVVDWHSLSSLLDTTTLHPSAASALGASHLSAEALPIAYSQRSHIGPNLVSSAVITPAQSPRAPGFGRTGPNQAAVSPLYAVSAPHPQGALLSSQAVRYAPNPNPRAPAARHPGPSFFPIPYTLAPTNTTHSRIAAPGRADGAAFLSPAEQIAWLTHHQTQMHRGESTQAPFDDGRVLRSQQRFNTRSLGYQSHTSLVTQSSWTTHHDYHDRRPLPRYPASPTDMPASSSGVHFSAFQSDIHAGRDFGSGNISQKGDGNIAFGNSNQIHIYHAGPNEEHKALLDDIGKKLGAYIAPDATLSKEVHGDPSLCYAGTRKELLERILLWVGNTARTHKESDVSSRALCIVGAPGSGKSTIMNTLIIELLDHAVHCSPGLISAHYCIRRSLHSTTDTTKMLPTIIFQLCDRQIEVARRVSQLLAPNQSPGVFHQGFLEQLFVEVVEAHTKTVFVIIDALDEASKPAILAATLSRVIHSAPPNFRLLLATRNEHEVLQGLGDALIPKIVHDIRTEESVDEVGVYIMHRLKDGLRELFGNDPFWSYWPDDSQLRRLSDKAGGLFIWARTAVDFILSRIKKQGKVKRDRLIEDVGKVGMADVNTLYMFILRESLPEDDVDDEDKMAIEGTRGVLGFITVAEDLLPLDNIVSFLGYDDYDVQNFTRLARSILVPGVKKITGTTVPQFHKTFFDFLTSDGAEEFQIDIEDAHYSAATRCFELMASQLRFNICRLRSSLQPDEGLDDIASFVPKGLIYASTSWCYHLKSTQGGGESQHLLQPFLPSIKTLLHEKLLFWLEIVSLSQRENVAADWLEKLATQLEDNELLADIDEASLSRFARDACLLIERFSECIGTSIPHLYISLLAFSPGDWVVANHYRKRGATTVIPHPSGISPQLNSWNNDPRMADDDRACSVSFSPCGRRLAVGYQLQCMRVWDVETGECVIGPLEGHNGEVNSVCFSPSGLLIASGSLDNSIRVWDAETGQCMLGPLTGHTGWIWSVAFSPDSTRIASGSWDYTVRVWDVRTGDCVLGPLEGHSDEVNCVSYSPDGSCIASGSGDATIRLWSTQTGKCICGPLEGHEDSISSLSFHPDGHRLASGSWDNTLRIWDIQKGTCTHDPLTGHTGRVISVSFSPDGQYIASSSNDCTIRIWDAETAVCVAGPFGGATDDITSVAFSPDDKYLAAGSSDGTVRLWDFNALLSAGLHDAAREDEASTKMEITDYTVSGDWREGMGGWTLGPKGELLFWAPEPFGSAIWRPSTVRILGRPSMIKPDLRDLVTGEEWLSCFPGS